MTDLRTFWDERAALGETAGTRDLWAKRLEVTTLKGLVRGPRILDAGCGDGETLMAVAATTEAVLAVGVDFSPVMLTRARAQYPWRSWCQGNLLEPIHTWGLPPGVEYDTVYTERVLVNLPDWAAQEEAIWRLASLVAPAGQLMLLENCFEGLAELNGLRAHVGLAPMTIPGHNTYVEASKMRALHLLGFKAPREVNYSAWYYLVSRVFHAVEAQARGVEPEYEHQLNAAAVVLSGVLPACPVACGPGRVWVIERT